MRIHIRIKSQINKLLPRASFARNVGILAGGTALAQALSVLALPFITRLYTPADFSLLAVYTALLGMIGAVACLRFEIAIPLPSDDFEAANLMTLGLFFTTIISTFVFLLVVLIPEQIASGLGQPALHVYLWLLPIGVWLTGAFGCVQFWATRRKKFTEIAQTRMTQSVSSVLTQLLMGWLTNSGAMGLLLGQVSGTSVGLIKLGRVAWTDLQVHKKHITSNSLDNSFKNNSHFPKYSTFEALANVATEQLPIIIIAATAIGPEAGFALLAMKSAAVPMGLIGSSISQVYLSRAPDELRAGKLPEFTQKILIGLIGSGVGPLVFAGILAPTLLPLVFGEQWARAGEIAKLMTPWFILQFLASPLSMVLHVTANQKLAMLNQSWGIFLRVGLTTWAAIYLIEYIVEIYALSGTIFYLGYLLIVLNVSGVKFSKLIPNLKSQLKIITTWTLLAIITKKIIDYIIH